MAVGLISFFAGLPIQFIVVGVIGGTIIIVAWGAHASKDLKDRSQNRLKNILGTEKPVIKDSGALNDWLEKDTRKKTLMEKIAQATMNLSNESGQGVDSNA